MSEGVQDDREMRLARRSPFAQVTKRCPKCLSPLNVVTRTLAGLVPLDYYCTKCGYSGSVYVEKDLDRDTGNR